MAERLQRSPINEPERSRWREQVCRLVNRLLDTFVSKENFQGLTPIFAGDTGGSSTAYTASISPAPTSLYNGLTVVINMHATNGANPTLNLNGLGAAAMVTAAGTAVATSSLPQYSMQMFTYYATVWHKVSP